MEVERRSHPAREYECVPSEYHLLSIHAGDSVEIEHAWGMESTRKALVGKGSVGLVPAGRPDSWRHTAGVGLVNMQVWSAFVTRVVAEERGDDGRRGRTARLYILAC